MRLSFGMFCFFVFEIRLFAFLHFFKISQKSCEKLKIEFLAKFRVFSKIFEFFSYFLAKFTSGDFFSYLVQTLKKH